MKLSIAGNPDNIKTVWAGQGLLAFVSGDDLVRFYYLDTDQSYFLSLSDHELGKTFVEDNFSCIDFNSRKRILVVGKLIILIDLLLYCVIYIRHFTIKPN